MTPAVVQYIAILGKRALSGDGRHGRVGGRVLLILWGLGLMSAYLLGGYFGAKQIRRYVEEIAAVRRARVESVLARTDAQTVAGALSTKRGECSASSTAWRSR